VHRLSPYHVTPHITWPVAKPSAKQGSWLGIRSENNVLLCLGVTILSDKRIDSYFYHMYIAPAVRNPILNAFKISC